MFRFMRHPTTFENKVYEALDKIPEGRVTTYRELGRHIDCGAPRAVGQALRRNPFAPKVPCHRVVRTDRSLGGYIGQTRGEALATKRKLLEKEGVPFVPGTERVAPESLFYFDD